MAVIVTGASQHDWWVGYRAALIAQYRAAATSGHMPAGFADALLQLIRCIESHAEIPPYDPAGPTAKQRRGTRP